MKNKKIGLASLLGGVLTLGLNGKANANGIEWIEHNDHFYKLTPQMMTWEEAENYAQSLHPEAHLVTLNDAEEEDWLISVFSSTQLWIGLFQKPGSPEPSGGWEWISGEPVTYTHWHSGEPNDNFGAGGEEWANMGHYGYGWNDTSSTNYLGVVESPVPEPSTIGLLGAGASALYRRRK